MTFLSSLANKIFGATNRRKLKAYKARASAITALEPEIVRLSDDELRAQTIAFRAQLANGAPLDTLLNPAFAIVREAAKRALGQRCSDAQLIGGMALDGGAVSEMKRGEGRALTAALPVYLNALTGRGVHMVAFTDDLARRDAERIGSVYRFLGLSVGCILYGLDDSQRRAAYGCDVTCGVCAEYGADYLRDSIKPEIKDKVQRGGRPNDLADRCFAIVDEANHILIDEAHAPLILSGPAADRSNLYVTVDSLIPKLQKEHYDLDEEAHSVTLTRAGAAYVEELLRETELLGENASVYDIENVTILHYVTQALKAHMLFARDRNYTVRDGRVTFIDEFSGKMIQGLDYYILRKGKETMRIHKFTGIRIDGRHYSEGVLRALEAREHMAIQPESQTLDSITVQNYFRLYEKLGGMSGAALSTASAFMDIYNLDVIVS
jgi:preprotein translocase subunit SecA